MSGTIKGGWKAAQTNKERHGEDFYRRIGQMGGRKSKKGGFAANRELASQAGRIGGKLSKRTAGRTPARSEVEDETKTRDPLSGVQD